MQLYHVGGINRPPPTVHEKLSLATSVSTELYTLQSFVYSTHLESLYIWQALYSLGGPY